MSLTKRIFRFILPFWVLILASIVASFLFTALNGISLWMTASFVETIFNSQEQAEEIKATNKDQVSSDASNDKKDKWDFNTMLKDLTKRLVERESKLDTLKAVCVIILLSFILKNIVGYFRRLFITRVNFLTVNNIRNELYGHLQGLSMSFFDKRNPGHITSIMLNDVNVLSSALTETFGKIILTPMQVMILVTLLFAISWKLTLMVFILIPVMGVIIQVIGKSMRRKSRRTYKQAAVFVSILQETILALRLVKAFAMERVEIKKFRQATDKYIRLVLRQRNLELISSPLNETLGVVAAVILLWYGGSQVLLGTGMASVDFVRYILLLFALFQPLRELTGINVKIQTGLAAAERIFGVLDSEPEIQDAPDAVEISDFSKCIEFKGVSFKYNEDGPWILKDIDLTVKRGEIVALVGHSGAGKSTLVDLIPRFYDIQEGEILIDGIDVRDIKNYHLKKLFGIVPQETTLFNESLKYNIAYGSSITDEKKIIQAAKNANAHTFINEIEKKYDTVVGDRGVILSGGQKQRISISRAILQNPPILILDEATSSLDTESERLVQDAINKLMENRTVIAIAHRLSTVIHADKIVVMDNGRIVDIGPHAMLLKKCDLYRNLYEMQFRDEEGQTALAE